MSDDSDDPRRDSDGDPVGDPDDDGSAEGRPAEGSRGQGEGAKETTGTSSQAVPPRAVLADALAPARDLLSRGGAVVGLPEPEVLAADVRSLGPHERFESSAGRHAERMGLETIDAASLAAYGSDLPIGDPIERATTFLARRGARLQGELLAELPNDPDRPRDYLLLAVAASHLQHAAIDLQIAVAEDGDSERTADGAETDLAVDAAGDATTDGDVERLASIALALTARCFDIVGDVLESPTERDPADATRDEPLSDAVVLDVALADHHRERARGGTPSFDPVERDVADLRELLAVQGASLAVTELDADPAALAALADVPPDHVLAVLTSD